MEEPETKPHIELYYSRRLKIGIPEVDEVAGQDDVLSDSDDERFLKDEKDTEDRISKLPDDALQFIILRLPMRQGAATSVLSSRWRHLWSSSAKILEFTDCSLFGYMLPSNFTQLKMKQGECQKKKPTRKEVVKAERTKFINLANHVLTLRTALTVHALWVRCPMGTESATHLDRWLKLAAAQGVRVLVVDLIWTDFDHFDWEPKNRYTFHLQRFSSLKHLYLSYSVFNISPRFRGLTSLVHMDLYDVVLTGSDVQSMLSKCPSLKLFSLKYCKFPNPTILKFVGQSIPVKHLHVGNCIQVSEIKLQDLNLLCCELVVAQEKISIKSLPHLIRLMLHIQRGNLEILSTFPRLETLILRHKYSDVTPKLPDLSALNNIKRLAFSVDSNLFEVVSLLQTFPLLQRMDIDMGNFNRGYIEPSELTGRVATTPGCPHSNLREVVIRGFENHPELIDLTKYLLKNATVLEKMKIYTACRSYLGNGCWCFSIDGKLRGKALKEVITPLKKETPPSTKLLVLRPY